jgi:hypothetical protein
MVYAQRIVISAVPPLVCEFTIKPYSAPGVAFICVDAVIFVYFTLSVFAMFIYYLIDFIETPEGVSKNLL